MAAIASGTVTITSKGLAKQVQNVTTTLVIPRNVSDFVGTCAQLLIPFESIQYFLNLKICALPKSTTKTCHRNH